MGLFDRMFGRGASEAAAQPKARDRFSELTAKYGRVLSAIERNDVQLRHLHVQDGKLVIRGDAPSREVKNRVWDEIRRVDPQYSDLMADIQVRERAREALAHPAAMTPGIAGLPGPVGAGLPRGTPSGGDAAPYRSAARLYGARTYTVKAGDTLAKIAQQFYGDEDEYMRIFYANRGQLGDPERIRVGQQLVIPPDSD